MSDWIKENAFILRALVFVIFAAWIGGPKVIWMAEHWDTGSEDQVHWSGRFEDLGQDKLEQFKADIVDMNVRADQKGTAYGLKSWLQDLLRIYELAEEYEIPYDRMGIFDRQVLGTTKLHEKAIDNM